MGEISKFWLVWNERGHTPRYKHDTRQAAETEAGRLAEKCPGETFIVLAAVSARVSRVSPPEALRVVKSRALSPTDCGIPF